MTKFCKISQYPKITPTHTCQKCILNTKTLSIHSCESSQSKYIHGPSLLTSRFHHFHHHYHCRCCRQEWITQQQYSQKRRTELSIRRSENTEGFSSTRCRMVEVELLRGLLLPLFPFRVTFKYIITIITIAIFIKMLPKTSKVRSLANCDGVA